MTPELTLTHSFLRILLTKTVHISEVSWKTPICLFFCQKQYPSKQFPFGCCSWPQQAEGLLSFWTRWEREEWWIKATWRDKKKKRAKQIVIIIKCLYIGMLALMLQTLFFCHILRHITLKRNQKLLSYHLPKNTTKSHKNLQHIYSPFQRQYLIAYKRFFLWPTSPQNTQRAVEMLTSLDIRNCIHLIYSSNIEKQKNKSKL